MSREPFTYRTRDGRTLSWGGLDVCVCTHCDEIFGSPAAFDAHLIRRGQRGEARHDTSRLVRNDRGWLVMELHNASSITRRRGRRRSSPRRGTRGLGPSSQALRLVSTR